MMYFISTGSAVGTTVLVTSAAATPLGRNEQCNVEDPQVSRKQCTAQVEAVSPCNTPTGVGITVTVKCTGRMHPCAVRRCGGNSSWVALNKEATEELRVGDSIALKWHEGLASSVFVLSAAPTHSVSSAKRRRTSKTNRAGSPKHEMGTLVDVSIGVGPPASAGSGGSGGAYEPYTVTNQSVAAVLAENQKKGLEDLKFLYGNKGYESREGAAPGRSNGHSDDEGDSCDEGGSDSHSVNKDIAEQLLEYAKTKTGAGLDDQKVKQLKKTASRLKDLTWRVTTCNLKEFQKSTLFCGPETTAKIKTILTHGRLPQLERGGEEQGLEVVRQLFCKIWGVGNSTAQALIAKGYRTLEDLRTPKGQNDLTAMQKVGLTHFDDINATIPREEVAAIAKYFTEIAQEAVPGVRCCATGSHRRGKEESGDVDIVISMPSTGENGIRESKLAQKEKIETIFRAIMLRLMDSKFVTHTLSSSYGFGVQQTGNKGHSKHGHAKFMGMCRHPDYPDRQRRLDFLIVPWHEWAPSLMHFTGSAYVNRAIRHLAKKKGWYLSQEGLHINTIRTRVNGVSERISNGTYVPLYSETDIFHYMGLNYLKPEERTL